MPLVVYSASAGGIAAPSYFFYNFPPLNFIFKQTIPTNYLRPLINIY